MDMTMNLLTSATTALSSVRVKVKLQQIHPPPHADARQNQRMRTFVLDSSKQSIILGRASQSRGLLVGANNLWIESPIITKEHARFVRGKSKNEPLLLRDLNSTHGTYVDNRRLKTEYVLQDGDIVTFGDHVTNGHLRYSPHTFMVEVEWQESTYVKSRSAIKRSLADFERYRHPPTPLTSPEAERGGFSVPEMLDDSESVDSEPVALETQINQKSSLRSDSRPSSNRSFSVPYSDVETSDEEGDSVIDHEGHTYAYGDDTNSDPEALEDAIEEAMDEETHLSNSWLPDTQVSPGQESDGAASFEATTPTYSPHSVELHGHDDDRITFKSTSVRSATHEREGSPNYRPPSSLHGKLSVQEVDRNQSPEYCPASPPVHGQTVPMYDGIQSPEYRPASPDAFPRYGNEPSPFYRPAARNYPRQSIQSLLQTQAECRQDHGPVGSRRTFDIPVIVPERRDQHDQLLSIHTQSSSAIPTSANAASAPGVSTQNPIHIDSAPSHDVSAPQRDTHSRHFERVAAHSLEHYLPNRAVETPSTSFQFPSTNSVQESIPTYFQCTPSKYPYTYTTASCVPCGSVAACTKSIAHTHTRVRQESPSDAAMVKPQVSQQTSGSDLNAETRRWQEKAMPAPVQESHMPALPDLVSAPTPKSAYTEGPFASPSSPEASRSRSRQLAIEELINNSSPVPAWNPRKRKADAVITDNDELQFASTSANPPGANLHPSDPVVGLLQSAPSNNGSSENEPKLKCRGAFTELYYHCDHCDGDDDSLESDDDSVISATETNTRGGLDDMSSINNTNFQESGTTYKGFVARDDIPESMLTHTSSLALPNINEQQPQSASFTNIAPTKVITDHKAVITAINAAQEVANESKTDDGGPAIELANAIETVAEEIVTVERPRKRIKTAHTFQGRSSGGMRRFVRRIGSHVATAALTAATIFGAASVLIATTPEGVHQQARMQMSG